MYISTTKCENKDNLIKIQDIGLNQPFRFPNNDELYIKFADGIICINDFETIICPLGTAIIPVNIIEANILFEDKKEE